MASELRRDNNAESRPGGMSRCEKVLRREVEACEDPVCCCEAEPRWRRFEEEGDVSEWEAMERVGAEEL